MRNFTTRIQNKANALALRARMALSNQRGDFYISDAVKIIIAVVLGAKTSEQRFFTATALLDSGFADYRLVTLSADPRKFPNYREKRRPKDPEPCRACKTAVALCQRQR